MRIHFECPACDRAYVFTAHPFNANEWDVITPVACDCGRPITNQDRAQMSRTCEANRIEGLRETYEASRDAADNSAYAQMVGK